MQKKDDPKVEKAIGDLAELGGRLSEDMGLGRVVGEILAYLYFRPGEKTASDIETDLGLSKGAVSVAVRQLENLGLVRRTRKKGERKNFYRTADNIAVALRQGILRFIRQKLELMEVELDHVDGYVRESESADRDLAYLREQLKRARSLRKKAAGFVDSPVLKLVERL